MGKLNYKSFVHLVNKEFDRLLIRDWIAYKAERTYHNQDAIEGGACRIIVWFKHKDTKDDFLKHHFLCFYTLKHYNTYLNEGYELYLKFDRLQIIANATIEVRKPTSK